VSVQRYYADLFFTRAPTVAGLQMLPYTLGHSFVLSALGIDRQTLTAENLLLVVWVCSRPWRESVRVISSGNIQSEAEAWGKKFGGILTKDDFEKVADYLETFQAHPPKYEVASKSKGCPFPWQLGAVWKLMERMTEDEAWNTEYNRAFAYIEIDRYMNRTDDKTDLISEEEEEENRRIAANG
jgi:hypothetical protein